MPRNALRASDPRKEADINHAWMLHRSPELGKRRIWLERHLAAQDGRCKYCNAVMITGSGGANRDLRPTIDHVVARAVGGPDCFENTVAACAGCNSAKGAMPVWEFERHPVRLARRQAANTTPDRLCVNPRSRHFDRCALERGVAVKFRGSSRTDVFEYCVSEGWVRVPAGRVVDRHGWPMTIVLRGRVEARYRDSKSRRESSNDA